MSYTKEVLQPDEKVLYDKNLHWVVYLRAVVFATLVMGLGLLFAASGNIAVLAVAIIISLAFFIHAWVKRISTEIVITDKRIILKTGILIRSSMEMNMGKVETVDVIQTILGRMFNYGTVIIRGTGSSYEPLLDIDSPIALRNCIIAK